VRRLILAQLRSALEDPQLFLQESLLSFYPARVDSALADTRLFFIVGMGRSGTVFLSHLLDRVPECAVYHEAPGDRNALVNAYWDPDKAGKHLGGSRQRLVAARIIRSNCRVYGEINSYLRHHVDALRAYWQPTILHLVRDGRSVVRSLMNRIAFSPADGYHTGRLAPLCGDPLADRWPDVGRFERVCWYWAYANRYLLERKLAVIRFEDVVRSYDQFERQVLQPLELGLPIEVWKSETLKSRNVAKDTSFPAWKDWTREQRHQFETICGPVMSDLGYAI
jgi:hypothetical protein